MGSTNYHTHSTYCDGSDSLAAMVQGAADQGLDAIGISSHSPLPYPLWYTLPLAKVDAYCAEVRHLQRAYAGQVQVWLGIELDYLPDHQDFFRAQVLSRGLDFVIGSLHYVGLNSSGAPWPIDESRQSFEQVLAERWGGDIRALMAAHYTLTRRMAALPEVTIIGHMDRIKRWNDAGDFFTETAPWYVAEIEATLQTIARHGKMVELNTAYGDRPIDQCYPSAWVLRRCVELGIPLLVNSDAHSVDRLQASLAEGSALLRDLGCRQVMALTDGGWVPRDL